jgi:ketosteroid isomerase-like protein
MSLPGFAVTLEATSAEVAASGDIGYTLGNFTYQMSMPDGSQLTDRGKYATIWKKQADATWKVAVDIFNSEIPMTIPPSDTTAVQGQ